MGQIREIYLTQYLTLSLHLLLLVGVYGVAWSDDGGNRGRMAAEGGKEGGRVVLKR